LKRIVIVSAAAGTLAGAAIGVVALGPAPASARATPAALTASGNPSGAPGRPGRGGPGGGPHELVSDTSVMAKAVGISESDLTAALAKGQTPAQVAKAHGVDPQKVVDALVADGASELADQVRNGQLTQAQADAQQSEVVRRATDQANGAMPLGGPDAGPGGRGGPGGGPGRPDDNDADDATPSPGAS